MMIKHKLFKTSKILLVTNYFHYQIRLLKIFLIGNAIFAETENPTLHSSKQSSIDHFSSSPAINQPVNSKLKTKQTFFIKFIFQVSQKFIHMH